MVDNQHKKIAGYRDLTEAEIALMNRLKSLEADLVTVLETVADVADGDQGAARWCALGRTHLETGMMFAIKAVAKPTNGLGRY